MLNIQELIDEQQMINSENYVDASWRYERIESAGHWVPLDAPARLNELLIDYFGATVH